MDLYVELSGSGVLVVHGLGLQVGLDHARWRGLTIASAAKRALTTLIALQQERPIAAIRGAR